MLRALCLLAAVCLACAHVAGGETPPQCQADILVVLDASGSVQKDFDDQVEMLRQFTNMLPEIQYKFRMALIRYSGDFNPVYINEWDRFPNKAAFIKKLDEVTLIGRTTYTGRALGILGALRVWLNRGDERVPPIMVSVTDGRAHDMPMVRANMAQMKLMNITSIAVSVHANPSGELHRQANPSTLVVHDEDVRSAAGALYQHVMRHAECDGGGTATTPGGGTATTPGGGTPAKEQCCKWAADGHCDTRPAYMRVTCGLACGTPGCTEFDVKTCIGNVSSALSYCCCGKDI